MKISIVLTILFQTFAFNTFAGEPLLDGTVGASKNENIMKLAPLRRDSKNPKAFWVIPGFESYKYCVDSSGKPEVRFEGNNVIVKLCSNIDEELNNSREALENEGIEYEELKVIPHTTNSVEALLGAFGSGICSEVDSKKIECSLSPSHLKKFFDELFSGQHGYSVAFWSFRKIITIEGLEHKDTDRLGPGTRTYGYGWLFNAPNMTDDKANKVVNPEKFLAF